MNLSKKAQRDQLNTEAAQWVVRLSDAPSAEERIRFEAWRTACVEHDIAYERELAAWERLDRLASLRAPKILPDADLLVSLNRASNPPAVDHVMKRSPTRRWLAIAACLLMIFAMGVVLLNSPFIAPAYATGIGERRLIVLSDGTRVELNTDSKIVVRYARDHREVELVRGEAMLDVARGGQPFVLRTEAGQLRMSRSAKLAVRMFGAAAKVTVQQGSVESLRLTQSEPQLLGAGSEALVGATETKVRMIEDGDFARELAWRDGAISLNGETIAEAVAEINRYNTRHIIVNDMAVGALRVGGYFDTLSAEEFARALAQAFALKVLRQPDGDFALVSGSPPPAAKPSN